jgi:hypothetical protein
VAAPMLMSWNAMSTGVQPAEVEGMN